MGEIAVSLLISFRRASKKLFTQDDLDTLIAYLVLNPEKGDVIAGTGGIRKLRWAMKGRGKRCGSRIIYYYHRPEWQIYLLSAYAKNEKEDISVAEKKYLAAIIKEWIG